MCKGQKNSDKIVLRALSKYIPNFSYDQSCSVFQILPKHFQFFLLGVDDVHGLTESFKKKLLPVFKRIWRNPIVT